MLAVTVELWPHGEKEDRTSLGHLLIANTGTGDEERGNYHFVVEDDQGERDGQIFGYKRSLGFWDLIQLCLEGDEEKRREVNRSGEGQHA